MLASLAKWVQTARGALPGQGKAGAAVGQKHRGAAPPFTESASVHLAAESERQTGADRLTNRGDLLGISYRDNQRIPE